MEPNTNQNQPVKINLNLGKLIDSIHVTETIRDNESKGLPSPALTRAIFENDIPRIVKVALVEALATVNWVEKSGDIKEVNINLDQLIGTILYDTKKVFTNQPVEVPDVEMMVDAIMEPLPERKPKSPLRVYPLKSQISEHGIREYEITKQEILKRVEDILNNATDSDEFERATIFLRLSVALDNHQDAAL